jgi:hypothetical protein
MTLTGPAIADFLAQRSAEAQTLFGLVVVLPLVVLTLLATETIRTSRLSVPGGTRALSVAGAGLVVLFVSIVAARLALLA